MEATSLGLRDAPTSARGNDPAGVVRLHSDMGIVGACLGSGEEDQRGVKPGRFMGAADQFLADPATLIVRSTARSER